MMSPLKKKTISILIKTFQAFIHGSQLLRGFVQYLGHNEEDNTGTIANGVCICIHK